MMTKTFCSFVLILSLLFSPLSSAKAFTPPPHYLLSHKIMFADADKIADSPFNTPKDFFTEKDAAESLAAGFPLLGLFLPAGYAQLGLTKVKSSIAGLFRQIDNLNKVAVKLTKNKAMILFPYLGLEGVELLPYFLSAKQTLTNPTEGVKNIRSLNHLGKRKKGVFVLDIRDMVHQFITQFQAKNTLLPQNQKEDLLSQEEASYSKDLRYFLNSLGLVTWNPKTIETFSSVMPQSSYRERELYLYKSLYKAGILDKDGSLYAAKSSSKIDYKLKKAKIPFRDLILHDLGLVHENDFHLITESILSFLEETKTLTPSFKEKLTQSLPSVFNQLQAILDTPSEIHNDLEKDMEFALLQGLVSKSSFLKYKLQHKVTHFKKNKDDHIVLLKLALVEELGGDYHYIKLDEDLKQIYSYIVKSFDSLEINNDLFRIVKLSNEVITLTVMNQIQGWGFITNGVARLIILTLNIALQDVSLQLAVNPTAPALLSQAAALSEAIKIVSFFVPAAGLTAGVMTFSMALYQFTVFFSQLVQLENSKRVASLLDTHLASISGKDKTISERQNKAIYLERFNIAADHYLKKLEQKSLLASLGLRSLWMGFGTMAITSSLIALLVLLGVTALAATGAAFGIATPIFIAVVMIPAMYLIMKENELQRKVAVTRQVIAELKQSFIAPKPSVEIKQSKFLELFLSNIEQTMSLAVLGSESRYFTKQLSHQHTPEDIEKSLVELYRVRKEAIHSWKKMEKKGSELTHNLAQDLISEGLTRAQIPYTWKAHASDLYPSTYRTEVDLLLESFHPGIEHPLTAALILAHPLPRNSDFFETDLAFSSLFNATYTVYNNILRNVYGRYFLMKKRNLQWRYFEVPLSKREIHLLEKQYKKNSETNKELLASGVFVEEIRHLQELHPTSYSSKDVPWAIELANEMEELMRFDRGQETTINVLQATEDREQKTPLPPHPFVDRVVDYFIPNDTVPLPTN